MSGTWGINVNIGSWIELCSVPSNLVCSIASYHVPHSFVTTRMIWHPDTHIQDFVVYNDNGSAFGDLTFNFPTTEDFSLPLCLRVHNCGVVDCELHRA